jgi:microcystin-dependent protein
MSLNKLDNFIKNTEGRILYVSPSDLDSTDSISNQGNSLAQPFKTPQRAILEAARFSYQKGKSNDITEKTTILLMPGEHLIDNRPGYTIYKDPGTGVAKAKSPSGTVYDAADILSLTLSSNFDLTQSDNILYKFNSVYGGVIVPRGTSIVGLDLRKTKIRPKYVPNPTDSSAKNSAIFRITGACYFWQFCIFDGNESGLVYTDASDFSNNNQSTPTFSHHKLTAFEYADGTNKVDTYDLTDLNMYYSKLSNAFNLASGRDIDQKYPDSTVTSDPNPQGFAMQRPEWEIVGAFATDPIQITKIESGSGGTASSQITVTTAVPHQLTTGTPIKIRGVSVNDYNVSTKVSSVDDTNPNIFTYLLSYVRKDLPANPTISGATATIETDTVSGASPYIFNISMRSIWGMNGMHADGSKSSGFRSMVVAQFTGVSLQKDDRAFVKYNSKSRNYESIQINKVTGASLSSGASSTDIGTVYHLDSAALYRNGWESSHIKASNDSFIQIVSVFAIGFTKHFDVQTGADFSITNSNSNFGQISLSATGFKKQAFTKDNKAFITSIIAPRAVVSDQNDIDWVTIDVGVTTSSTINPSKNRLYLYGYTSIDDIPPTLTQGYKVGAKLNDVLYITANNVEYSANILMSDGSTSSVKEYVVTSGPLSNSFTIGSNTLDTGEKVIIISDDGDLPENIVENTVYYVIDNGDNNTIKLASSSSNAANGTAIDVYLGTSLKILSRVTDKIAGEIGSPVQYDSTNNQWYINTNANSGIWNALNTLGVSNLTERTENSYIKRVSDSRSLDEKIYKIRVVIPKEYVNAKKPENGFIIQESSTTGVRSDTDFNISTIQISDTLPFYDYNKNPRFIAKCSLNAGVVTVVSELAHNLQVGDSVIIKNVTDSSNTIGADNLGYNGTFTVASIVNDMSFTYTTTKTLGVTFTNNTSNRTTLLPRFERNNLQSNFYIYRNEVIKNYIEGIQDGVYHLYVLNAKNAITTEFTNLKYSQNVVNLYPQLDRDNINDNPYTSKSFATRFPLGQVVTNDIKKSITRETVDSLLTSLNIGLDVSAISDLGTSATITFSREHGLSGIATYNNSTSGSFPIQKGNSYTNGTYYNVKLFNDISLTDWRGATAKVIVSGNAINFVDITSSGSGYSAGNLYFDTSVIGTGNLGRLTISDSGISTSIGNVIQFTGTATPTGYYRITSVPTKNQIAIAKTAGDPAITTFQYGFVTGRSIRVSSSPYNSANGVTTFNCLEPHGLLAGNKFRVIDSSNNTLGVYIVTAKNSVTSFTAVTNVSVSAYYVFKHGLSSNNAISDDTQENIGVRDISIFDDEILNNTLSIDKNTTQIKVSSPTSSTGIEKRFPLGSYIQIDGEIMRITSSTLSGGDTITVIRSSLGTINTAHDAGSLIKKIKPIPIEFRRPAILRASGHTFEYLGYGPGNYSTGLPQVQIKTLTEREDFLAQSQERSGGLVVYTGMNSNGDVFNGNTKTSSSSGEVVSYDIPKPTITGEDPSRSSVVYDEVTIKERLIVEGGNSSTVLSQFNGPVAFNQQTTFKNTSTFSDIAKIISSTSSNSTTKGALVVKGGVGVGENLNIGGSLSVIGSLSVNGSISVSGGISVIGDTASIGTAIKPFINAYIGKIRIAVTDDGTIDTSSGNLKLGAATGSNVAISTTTTITGDLNMTSGSGVIRANYLDVPNVTPIGGVVIWTGTIGGIPSGWALCNGQAVSRTTYATLFSTINVTYGSGDGSTTFNLPNLVQRFPMGAGDNPSVDGVGSSRGTVGGSPNATLPEHNHIITNTDVSPSGAHNHEASSSTEPNHRHYLVTNNSNTTGISDTSYAIARERSEGSNADYRLARADNVTSEATSGKSSLAGEHTHNVTITADQGRHSHAINNQGVSPIDANLPPYLVLHYIIRLT